MSSSKIDLLEREMIDLWNRHYDWILENTGNDPVSVESIEYMRDKRLTEVKGTFNAARKL